MDLDNEGNNSVDPVTHNLLNNISVNGSSEDANYMLEKYLRNRQFTGSRLYLLIIGYGVLILFGTIGNILVVSAVIRKPAMRTARNMFIVNLAVSDLLLCVFTMPLTFWQVATIHWPFGSSVFFCKLLSILQATSVFVSTLSILAIALDRYYVILYPTQQSVQRLGVFISIMVIWVISSFLVAPLFIWTNLETHRFGHPQLSHIYICFEAWPGTDGRFYYSAFTFVIQFVVPLCIVSLAYARICRRLRVRVKMRGLHTEESEVQRGASKGQSRVQRTNKLLIAITIIFAVSWIPLNALNAIVDRYGPEIFPSKELYLTLFAVCHMFAMSSACSNPVLYGWLNDNFKKEFKEIWSSVRAVCSHAEDNGNGSEGRTTAQPHKDHFSVRYEKSRASVEGGEIEQSTLITQVSHRQKVEGEHCDLE